MALSPQLLQLTLLHLAFKFYSAANRKERNGGQDRRARGYAEGKLVASRERTETVVDEGEREEREEREWVFSI